jgi:hypothetical protein
MNETTSARRWNNLAAGRVFESSGDYKTDMAEVERLKRKP